MGPLVSLGLIPTGAAVGELQVLPRGRALSCLGVSLPSSGGHPGATGRDEGLTPPAHPLESQEQPVLGPSEHPGPSPGTPRTRSCSLLAPAQRSLWSRLHSHLMPSLSRPQAPLCLRRIEEQSSLGIPERKCPKLYRYGITHNKPQSQKNLVGIRSDHLINHAGGKTDLSGFVSFIKNDTRKSLSRQ